MAKCRSRAENKYSADQLMSNVAQTLIRDFRSNLNDPTFCCDLLTEVRKGDIGGIRRLAPPTNDQMSVAEFKATYQMASLHKRFRYQDDIYGDDELTQKAIDTFLETQNRISAIDLNGVSTFTTRVLDLAKIYISRVLGVYSDELHRNLCRFGRKASVGVPARSACEAARWELPLSGSLEQIAWFDSEMSQIDCVQEYWYNQIHCDLLGKKPVRSFYQATSSLKLTLVPKSFKSLRAIMPNTTIGSYMSFGLGEMMRKRLKREGYDISSLQMRHRSLACQGSVHNLTVTADLSSASDSISTKLVERLFPSDWFDILNQSRIGTVVLPNNQRVESLTFCTMGVGYTFPLQTLVFLALLKSIQATLYDRFDRRTISVYGDDMIYSSRMHKEVVQVFQELGFVINLDKTFHEGQFRESCGGDYYRGVDVRPFQPQNGPATVRKRAYEAILYKFVNGLLARWSEYEISGTLDFLTHEIESVTGKCKIVPKDHPDDSGIKCPTLAHWGFLMRAKVAAPKKLGNGVYRFSYLRFEADERKELRHEPYLWVALRGRDHPVFDYAGKPRLPGPQYFLRDLIDRVTGNSEVSVPSLIVREDHPIVFTRSTLTGERLRRKSAYVTISHTGRYTRQSGTSCFEDRR